ncbi:MAG: hypothetical protein GYB48_12115 [Gammaproteobacteria bacterium]|nr:hypothetical protein [Gammaproteobacteria bacterium]
MKTSRLKLTGSGLMLAAGLLFTSWGSLALAEDAPIPLVMEQSVTGVIDEREGDQLLVDDMGFVLQPDSRILNRNGRELKAFHLTPGQEVEVRFDPRGEPKQVIDITLLRRGR